MSGKVAGICISPKAGAPMESVYQVLAIAGAGLSGDRYCAGEGSFNRKTGKGNRQVTLMRDLALVNSGFEFSHTRRNILISGTEVVDLIGKEFQIGEAIIRGLRYCDPCNRPSTLIKSPHSFKDALTERGGIIGEVLMSGLIKIDSIVIPPPKGY